MDLTARIEDAGDASNLVGTSQVSMSGKAAAFGARVVSSVADQILKQFAANFAARVAALASPPPPGASAAGDAGEAPAGASAPAPAPASQRAASRELNGLALMWAVFKDWLRSLFGKSAA